MPKFYRNRFTLGSIPQLDVSKLFPTSNLLAYYRMEETSGTIMTDAKGNYNGSLVNVSLNQVGKKNKCYSFNGSNAYADTGITIPSATSSTIQSYAVWVYFDGTTTWVLGSNASSTGMFHLYCELSSSSFTFGVSYYGGSGSESITTVQMSINTGWHLVCVVKTSAYYFNIYFDNVKIINQAYRVASNSSILRLGMRYSNKYYSGKQDELAVFSSLSEADINLIWNNGNGIFY